MISFDEGTDMMKPVSNWNIVDRTQCLHQIFEHQVLLTPNNPALLFNKNVLSFSELNIAANRLAAFLVANYKIVPDTIIGIMLDRSEKMLIAMLAVLKTGGAYLPLDPESPVERNAFICTDAAVKVVLTDKPSINKELFKTTDFIDLADPANFIGSGENLPCSAGPNNLAYVIFTSGSTGTPKGVLIEHQSVTNFIKFNIDEYAIADKEVFLLMSNFFFDAAVWELFVPLLTGSCLSILEPGAHKFPAQILDACAETKVSMFFLTPAVLQLMLNYISANIAETQKLKTLKRLIVGGDVSTAKLVNEFNKYIYKPLGAGLTNIYGPTETTVWVTRFDCESDTEMDVVPIGKAVENTEIYILDPNGNVVPTGEKGELVVGGIPVARGYLNRPDLNEQKFVPNPFRKGEKMYHTGDLARQMPDGNIEFFGRMDNQVKLNGLRIELSEIEHAVLKLPFIKECLVLLREVNNASELVLYYTLNHNEKGVKTDEGVITAGLLLSLPAYMIPSFFVELPAFPLNVNGKFDRKNLPLPQARFYQTPSGLGENSTETEKKIAALVSGYLKIKNIGADDNLIDLGVKSLMITKIILDINALLQSDLKLATFFQTPTIRGLANYIDKGHLAEAGLAESDNPFVLLREGEGEPLFLLFDAITFMKFLDHYHVRQPLYSIAQSDDDAHAAFQSVPEYAKYLISKIKLIQPIGPYNFMGYSFGGSMAYEIALQLQQAGDRVNLLAIISADAPIKTRFLPRQAYLELTSFLKPNLYLIKNYFKRRAPHVIGNLLTGHKTKADSDRSEVMLKLWGNYHTPLKYKGDILLIYEDATKVDPSQLHLSDNYSAHIMAYLWEKIIDGKVTSYKVPVSHHDLFSEPSVAMVAGIIEAHVLSAAVVMEKVA